VQVDGQTVIEKGFFGFPEESEIMAAVKKKLAAT
jgi:hypothetical protein